ncbi:MAG: cryptochrome/photolyase family protein, partial [Halothiobacillaceae bacterium]
RIALFLAAMRHFRDALHERGIPVHYLALEAHDYPDLATALDATLAEWRPQRIRWVRHGEWRVWKSLSAIAQARGVPVDECADRHFLSAPEEFAAWADRRKQLRQEYWYRHLRQRLGVLMDGDKPVGGQWNFDSANRKAFDARGPGLTSAPRAFEPDETTRAVLTLVTERFADHPGSLAAFDWPVTPRQAAEALDDFITNRLASFGDYQDAMWAGAPWLFHSRLSAAMNLKLIRPQTVVRAAEQAWQRGEAPLNAVEGFIRQVMGWREYVRGLYWLYMPEFADWNALGVDHPLPDFYWTGETDMRCLADAIGQTLKFGYAHHIQRLMVTGLFAQLLGVAPRAVHEWYLAVYVDAVEWVELPNVLGMSQFADGGRMASKPYVASGRYIQRMGNHCAQCRFDPAQATGARACPFTTLYWDFLQKHQDRFARHPRTALQWRNLDRIDPARREQIRQQAAALRDRYGCGG